MVVKEQYRLHGIENNSSYASSEEAMTDGPGQRIEKARAYCEKHQLRPDSQTVALMAAFADSELARERDALDALLEVCGNVAQILEEEGYTATLDNLTECAARLRKLRGE